MWDIGVDIVEVQRFRRIDYTAHKAFYNRIFTPQEIAYCISFKNAAPHFAATFAGKEAVYKAINNHIKVRLSEIEILRDTGVPKVNLITGGHNISKRGNTEIDVKVSLSHSSSYAVAFAFAIFDNSKEMDDSVLEEA